MSAQLGWARTRDDSGKSERSDRMGSSLRRLRYVGSMRERPVVGTVFGQTLGLESDRTEELRV